MSADNYALIGIHPLAGTGVLPETLHGVYIGFISSVYQPSAIPEWAPSFSTHEEAVAYATPLFTEDCLAFLCNCHRKTGKAPAPKETPVAEWEKELLYPAPKKTVRQVITEYADTLNVIYEERTAGDFTWKGLLHEFMAELAMAVDE